MKFNLGCGNIILGGYINVDARGLAGVNQIRDLNMRDWGLGENCADEIIAHDIFEHLDDVVNAMDNCAKLLKANGRLEIRAPHAQSELIWLDPTHKRGFDIRSFDYFDWSTELGNRYHYGAYDWRIESKIIDGGNVIVKMRAQK